MKFDKETVIVLVIAVAILVGWALYYPKHVREENAKRELAQIERIKNEQAKLEQQTAQQKQVQAVPAQTPAPVATPVATQPEKKAEPAKTEPSASTKSFTRKFPVLENDNVKLTFDSVSGTLVSADLKKFRKNADSPEGENIVIRPEGNSKQTFFSEEFSVNPTQEPVIDVQGNTLKITRVLPKYTVYESFTLKDASYQLDVSYIVVNSTGTDSVLPEVSFWAAGLPPMRFMTKDKSNTPRHNIDYSLAGSNKVKSFEPDAKDPDDLIKNSTLESVSWVASSNKYFVSFLLAKPGTNFNGGTVFSQVVEHMNKEDYPIPSVGAKYKNITLRNGVGTAFEMSYYCGPKELKCLDTLPVENATDVMHVGYWSWFEFIARPLARFLVWIHKYIGSYGLSIILLTLIVRGVLWPITQKSTTSMRRMQKIQPQLTALREKFKDNPQELNARMMELYRKEGVNPLGGCLPMLLQMPIFFALYSVFDAAVEMRHVSFLWAADLAQPDQVGPAFSLLGFNLAIHPFIIMQTILMVVQMKISQSSGSKTAANDQQKMQQKMMTFMPILMLVMLYWLPSGLTLYWTVSNAISLIQTLYGQHLAKLEDAQEKASEDNKKKIAKAK